MSPDPPPVPSRASQTKYDGGGRGGSSFLLDGRCPGSGTNLLRGRDYETEVTCGGGRGRRCVGVRGETCRRWTVKSSLGFELSMGVLKGYDPTLLWTLGVRGTRVPGVTGSGPLGPP